jgi:hypothetical protein
MDDTDLPRQWCQVCQVLHLPLWLEGCDVTKAPVKTSTKPRGRRGKTATAIK